MYSEAGADYIYNMERLIRKFKTAADLVPQPIFRKAAAPTKLGVIYYGSTTPAMREALDVLERNGDHVDAMRLCAFPFPDSVAKFIAEHDKVFVAEQNRDGQMRTMLINELEVNPAKLIRVLHYDGTPITARFIIRSIHESVAKEAV
jgi:2-oxoglutarate ferredoxin oxidoreductase subunit alpha